jgi:hypothetical protein
MLDRRHHSVIWSGETLLKEDFYARPTRRVTEVFLILAVIVFLALFWDRLPLPWKSSASAQTAARSTIQVWVNKKSGFYYCPDSRLYGKLKSGFFMPQGKALEAGYRPPFNETCQ